MPTNGQSMSRMIGLQGIEEVMIPTNAPRLSLLGEEFMWNRVWPTWETWIRNGLKNA